MPDDSPSTDVPASSSPAPNDSDTRSIAVKLRQIQPETWLTIAFALLALPTLAALDEQFGLASTPLQRTGLTLAVGLVVVGVTLGVEHRSLASIGFRRPAWRDVGYVVAITVLALGLTIAAESVADTLGLPMADSDGPTTGLWVALAGAVTTGVVEEILYRGYPLERLLEQTDSAVVAGGLTWFGFTAAHLVAWPLGNLVGIALGSALLTVVYLRRRTLVPVAGGHVLVLVLGVLGQHFG